MSVHENVHTKYMCVVKLHITQLGLSNLVKLIKSNKGHQKPPISKKQYSYYLFGSLAKVGGRFSD